MVAVADGAVMRLAVTTWKEADALWWDQQFRRPLLPLTTSIDLLWNGKIDGTVKTGELGLHLVHTKQ